MAYHASVHTARKSATTVGPVEISTARLHGRPVTTGDLVDFRRLFQDEQVALTMAGKRTDAEVDAIVAADVAHWVGYGYGCWSLRSAATGEFVGRGGLRRVDIDDVGEETELAYALLPAFWRQGLATEIARFSVTRAFDVHGLSSVVAMTLPTNEGSRRVMADAGLTYERDIVKRGLPHVLYRLSRPSA